MTAGAGRPKSREEVVAPGDDVVPVPPPVTEDPPYDRYCDLVLTGGVASGVVYPWAIVELARAFRFRNIGGTSVGAMAAALAAASEYGRLTGSDAPFEVLRRAPAALARTLPDGRTRMLSLFQTNPHGERLMRLWGELGQGNAGRTDAERRCPRPGGTLRTLRLALCIYKGPAVLGAFVGASVLMAASRILQNSPMQWNDLLHAFVVLAALLGGALGWALSVWRDLRYGVIENFYGLCKGGTTAGPRGNETVTGISDWLHDSIQRSAGLKQDDPPLTFGDLWSAPEYPGAARRRVGPDEPMSRRSINLMVIATNVTHGRPYRLPSLSRTSRLFFMREELEGFFPPCVLAALVAAGRPYAPFDHLDPPTDRAPPGLLELPSEKLPVAVAARLSMSFPLLFSAVPLWAIDYEAPQEERTLRRCIFTDGGVSSNFPIHLFDEAVPRWPTFGFWLTSRPPFRYRDETTGAFTVDPEVWRPKYNRQGWGDNWDRFDPESRPDPAKPLPNSYVPCKEPARGSYKFHADMLRGFLRAIFISATDWRDRTSVHLPHVRNRVARMLLLPGEGGLHIGMPREQILRMAHRYGTAAGQEFVRSFVEPDGGPSRAWSEQRWIRFNLAINGVRERLDGLATRVAWPAHTLPLRQGIRLAARVPGPVTDRGDGHQISAAQATSLIALVGELERLEVQLQATSAAFESAPEPELRLRSPL